MVKSQISGKAQSSTVQYRYKYLAPDRYSMLYYPRIFFLACARHASLLTSLDLADMMKELVQASCSLRFWTSQLDYDDWFTNEPKPPVPSLARLMMMILLLLRR